MESTSWCICTYKYICVQPLLGGSIDPRTLKLGEICYLGLRNILRKFGKINFPTPLLTYLSKIVRRLYHLSVVLSMLFQMIPLRFLYDINYGRGTLYKVEKTTFLGIGVRCHFTNLITSSFLHLQCCSWYHTLHHHQFYP